MPPVPQPSSVVLVDDSGDLRAMYRIWFDQTEDFGVVAEATDGLEGLNAAREHQPDLVLLDVAMPVMDGVQALPLIVAECPHTTVVMLTAYGLDTGLGERTAALGAAGYLLKGTPMPAMLTELREILAPQQASR